MHEKILNAHLRVTKTFFFSCRSKDIVQFLSFFFFFISPISFLGFKVYKCEGLRQWHTFDAPQIELYADKVEKTNDHSFLCIEWPKSVNTLEGNRLLLKQTLKKIANHEIPRGKKEGNLNRGFDALSE